MTDDLYIRGSEVDSINEYNVAMALERLNYDYEYQYWVGPPFLRGSQLIDFIVYSPPSLIPLQVYGAYWHDNFGYRMSAGCVNLRPKDAKWLYRWTTPVLDVGEWHHYERGTRVDVV